MNANEKVLERLQNLIAKGQKIADSRGFMTIMPSDPLWVDVSGWRAQTVTCLIDILGNNSIYKTAFLQQTQNNNDVDSVKAGLVTLEAVKEDIENGYMQTYRQLIEADLLDGLMGQAEHLLERGYLLAAAAVAGAALQQGLEELSKRHNLKVQERENLDSLADKLLQAEVFDATTRRQLSFITGVRNSADHGKVDELSTERVESMVRGSVDFLAKHAT